MKTLVIVVDGDNMEVHAEALRDAVMEIEHHKTFVVSAYVRDVRDGDLDRRIRVR